MDSPTVSVIIPTYNGGRFLVEAIQSVLNQTYCHFELIVVDDVSPDNTGEIVKQFKDPRLKYVLHDKNQGAIAARKTGVDVSTGKIIAFLDQDDLFHPEKLQTHVTFLEQHPDIGLAYNSRFELEPGTNSIRAIWQPPPAVTLTDLVIGFPFSPSDTVLRREWAGRADIWDQSFVLQGKEKIFNGGEIVFGGRLALAGCKFANVNRVLNYRRYFPRRVFTNLEGRCKAERTCQTIILDDPRCLDEMQNLRTNAFLSTFLIWAYYAFAQEETSLGQSFLREAVRLRPSLVVGEKSELVNFLVATSSAVEGSTELEANLRKIFSQLPSELDKLSNQLEWAIAQGYLIIGTQAMLWDRLEEGRFYFTQAVEYGVSIEESFIHKLTYQLLVFQNEFGTEATQRKIHFLVPYLEYVDKSSGKRLQSCYSINCAFQNYQAGEYTYVPGEVMRAVMQDPKYLFNRGVLAILLRSITNLRTFKSQDAALLNK